MNLLVCYFLIKFIRLVINQFKYINKQIKMGLNSSHDSQQFKNNYIVVSTNQAGQSLLRHKKTHKEVMLRKVNAQSQQELLQTAQLISKRRKIKNVHLLQIFQMNKLQEDRFCSNTKSAQLFLQYPFQNLQTQFQQRKNTKNKVSPMYFSESQLWSILYSCALALESLYLNDLSHQSLTKQQIFIDKEGIIKLADPIALQLSKNYTKVLQKLKQIREEQALNKSKQLMKKSGFQQDKNIEYINKMHHMKSNQNSQSQSHISPEQISLVKQNKFYYYDKEKSDIYVLAILMIELSTLNDKKINYQRMVPFQFTEELKHLKERYSIMYVNLLSKMLQVSPKERVTLQQIINQVQSFSTQDGESQISKKDLSNRKNDFAQFNAQNNYLPQEKNIQNFTNSYQPGIPYKLTFSQNNNLKSESRFSNSNSILNSNNKIVFNGNTKFVQNSFKPIPTFNYTPYNNLFSSLQTENSKIDTINLNPSFSQQKFEPFYIPEKQRFSLDKFGHINLPQQQKKYVNQQIQSSKSIFTPIDNNKNYFLKGQTKLSQINSGDYLQNLNKNYLFSNTNNMGFAPINNNPDTNYKTTFSITSNINNSGNFALNTNLAKNNHVQKVIVPQIVQISDILTQSQSKSSTKSQKNNLNEYKKQQWKNISSSQIQAKIQDKQRQSLNSSRSAVDQLKKIDQLSLQDYSPKQKLDQSQNKKQKLKSAKKYNFYKKQLAQQLIKIDPSQVQKNNYNRNQASTNVNTDKTSSLNNFQKEKQKYSTNQQNHHVKLQQIDQLIQKFQKPTQKAHVSFQPQIHSEYVEQFNEGCKYMGYKLDGKRHGLGIYYFSDGGYYDGQWYEDQMHGFGKLYFRNNQLAYQGNFNHELFEGFGTLYNDRPKELNEPFDFSDMKNVEDYWIYYKGNFKNDCKQGKGLMMLTNGQEFEGYFDQDTIHGEGKYKLMNKKVISGLWKNNILIQINDQIKIGNSEISSISQNDADRLDSNSDDF